MWGFISFVFWLVLFLMGAFFFGAVLLDSSDEQLEEDTQKRRFLWNFTSIEHINRWKICGFLLGSYVFTLLGAWGMDFLYAYLWLCLFALVAFIFALLTAAGLNSENLSDSIVQQVKSRNLDSVKDYLPTYSLMASFCLILLFNAVGMQDYDSQQSSSTKSASSSSSTQSTKVKWRLDGDSCPTKNGEAFGNSPGQVAGRIFDIKAARGDHYTNAVASCKRCIINQFNDAYRKYGTTGSVTSPQTQYCDRLLDTFSSNRAMWQQMQRETKYR